MSSKNTPSEGATRQTTRQPKQRKPVVNARPLAALVGNTAVVTGATLAAAGGLPAVAAGAAAATVAGAAALGTKKVKQSRAAAARAAALRAPRAGATRSSAARSGSAGRKGAGSASGTGTRKGAGIGSLLGAARRRAGTGTSGSGKSGTRTPGIFRRAAAASRKAAAGTRKAAGPTFRGIRTAAAGTRTAARKTGTGLKWTGRAFRNLWRRITGRKPVVDPKDSKVSGTVADPKRKAAAKMAAAPAVAAPAPGRPAPTSPRTPTGRALSMSATATRMSELANEMLATAAAFKEQLAEQGSGVGLMHYADDLLLLPDVLRTLGEVIEQYRLGAEEHLPVPGLVVDAVGEVRGSQESVAEAAEAASSILETVMDEELERLRNPQPNAHKADVTENMEV